MYVDVLDVPDAPDALDLGVMDVPDELDLDVVALELEETAGLETAVAPTPPVIAPVLEI